VIAARLAIVALLLSACTSIIPANKGQDLTPRKVKNSLTIGVNPLLFNLEPGTVVGGRAESEADSTYDRVYHWNEDFKLRRHAFSKSLRDELTSNGFALAIGDKAAYQLRSTVEYMVYNRYGNKQKGSAEAEVKVLWQFEGPQGLEKHTHGYARVEVSSKEALVQAFRVSLRNFLAREDVVERFAPKGIEVAIPDEKPADPAASEPIDPPRPTAIARKLKPIAAAASDLGEEPLNARVRPGVVTLLARDRWSSGVIIDDNGLVITTARLVAGVSYVNLVLSDGTTRAAKVLQVDKEADLALVRSVSSGRFQPLPVAMDRPQVAAPISAYGTPYHPALSHSTTRGTVVDADGDRLLTDVKVIAGNAGGPVVNNRGEVVGIVTWDRKATDSAAPALCIPMAEAFKALRLSYE